MPNKMISSNELPNIYFDKIKMDVGFGKISIRLFLSMLDYKGAVGTWWFRSEFIKYMNINVCVMREPNNILSLVNNYTIENINNGHVLIPTALCKTRSLGALNLPVDEVEVEGETFKVYRHYFDFSFEVDLVPHNIYAYAFADLSIPSIESDYGADLNYVTQKNFRGALSGEALMVKNPQVVGDSETSYGFPVTRSYVFYVNGTNTIWGGPVHQVDGTYYAGHVHKPFGNTILIRSEIENKKLLLMDINAVSVDYQEPEGPTIGGFVPGLSVHKAGWLDKDQHAGKLGKGGGIYKQTPEYRRAPLTSGNREAAPEPRVSREFQSGARASDIARRFYEQYGGDD